MKNRFRLSYLLIGVTVVIQGCISVGPDYKRLESSDIVPTSFSVGNNSTQEQEQIAAPISSTWWELYQDPVLNDLVAKALENNTDIKLAIARVEEADAYLQEAVSYTHLTLPTTPYV